MYTHVGFAEKEESHAKAAIDSPVHVPSLRLGVVAEEGEEAGHVRQSALPEQAMV